MNRLFKYLPEITGEEMNYIHALTKELNDEDMQTFANIYRARRRDPQTVLLLALVSLFVLPGLQRFYVDQIAMGVLFLFTWGLCFVGSIIDLINYQSLAREYNSKVAADVLTAIKY